jgi:hypothetical protein
MAKVEARSVMALHRLTDLPLSMCREALVEAGGDIGEVIQHLRGSPCCGLHAPDAEVAALLASHGVTWIPPVRLTRAVPEEEVVSELVFNGQAVADYFLVGGLVCHINARGELMSRVIDDPDLATATIAYLRRVGAREFGSLAEFQSWRSEAE